MGDSVDEMTGISKSIKALGLSSGSCMDRGTARVYYLHNFRD